MDETGRTLGQGEGKAANPQQVGWTEALAAVRAAVARAADRAGVDANAAAAITLALAGVDRADERATLTRLARDAWPSPRIRVENDALAALVAGVGTAYGIVLVAGTGMIAYGVNETGAVARAGGWGYRADPGGSGYTLGLDAIRAVLAASDGTGPATCLQEILLAHLNLSQPADLIPWLYGKGAHVEATAALAPHVLACAVQGDPVAAGIVARSADALADAAWAVARRLGLDARPCPVVLAGGLLTRSHFYRAVVTQAVHTRLPLAQVDLAQRPAAVGAALLAWEDVGRPLPDWQPRATSAPVWATEQPNVLTRGLDTRTPFQIVGLMHEEDRRAVAAVRSALVDVAAAVEAIVPRMAAGGRLIYVGAGTPGRLGVLDASECPPTFGVPADTVTAVIAGGEQAIRYAVEGAEDDEDAGRADMARLRVGPQDTVVGISASGRTPYVRAALREARQRGALTVAVVCNALSPMEGEADHVIRVPAGPEVIAGSTRLKAGTVQKLVLNMLSTASMVRLGKVFDNLMVDVQPANRKLRHRAQRILTTLAHIEEQEARALLERSNWNVKVALVSALAGCSVDEARSRLQDSGGRVREAVGARDNGGARV